MRDQTCLDFMVGIKLDLVSCGGQSRLGFGVGIEIILILVSWH